MRCDHWSVRRCGLKTVSDRLDDIVLTDVKIIHTCLIGPQGLVSGVPSVSTSLAKTDGLTGYPTYRVLSGTGYELGGRGESNSLVRLAQSSRPR